MLKMTFKVKIPVCLAIILALGFSLILPFAVPDSNVQAAQTVLNVYNWGQYISDGTDGYIDVIKEFEKEYPDIRVNYLTFDSNETMYTKLKTDPGSFDLIVPSDYMIEKLIQEDMLAELDFSNIPNYQYIDDSFRNTSYDPENKYSVPYTWGCVGIIYNSRYVNPDDATGWELLWNPSYAGKILMFDNPRDAFAIAELELGYNPNTEDPEEMGAAAKKLTEQKNLVQAYVMDQVFDKMERSEAWVAPYYVGDYILMVEENPDLEFYYPSEGFNMFIDAFCVPKQASHKEAAELFINFMCRPDICGENLEYLGYSVPESAAKEYMDPEITENEIVYPSEEILSGGVSFNALSQTGNQLMNELWLSVKTSEDILGRYIIITGAAIVLCVGFLLIHSIRTKKRIKRRGTYR